MSAPKSTPLICSGHTRPVSQLAFSGLDDEGRYYLISSCKDGKAMLRDGMLGDWLGTFLGHKGAVWCSMLSHDGSKAITGSADFTAKIWETYNGSALLTLNHNHIVRSVDMSKDGQWAATGCQDKTLRLFDLQKPEEPTLFGPGGVAHKGLVRSLVLDMNRRVLVSVDDKEMRWWSVDAPSEPVQSISFESIVNLERCNDDTLALCSGKSIHFIDIASRETTSTLSLQFTPSSASIHPVLKDRFVTGSTEDGWVRVHSIEDGSVLEVLKGHHGSVHCIAYSPDGELYASGSEDGTIRLWQTTAKTYGLWKLQGEAA